MSQMSKYAMPSSTPLYHDAIKTIATSDDEMLPDRPLLSGVSIGGRKTENTVNRLELCRDEAVEWPWCSVSFRFCYAIRKRLMN